MIMMREMVGPAAMLGCIRSHTHLIHASGHNIQGKQGDMLQ